jgi:aminodeoxyfutalosine deaminase
MRFLSATHVFDGTCFLNTDPVLVLDEKNCFVEYVDRKTISPDKIEKHDGILSPGFVNAHCHLELSHMRGVIPERTGLLNFAKNIITKRGSFAKEQINEAIVEADKVMWDHGIVAVGDISNTADSFQTKQKSNLFYHTFIELIGFDPGQAETVFTMGKELQRTADRMGLKNSLVPHAPYSVSEGLMRRMGLDVIDTKFPVSIHNQESADEDLFFKRKEGAFVELYDFLKMPIDFFKPRGYSSLQTYLMFLENCSDLILVHNTFTSKKDMEWANSYYKKLYWCLCPKANLYIENALPQLDNFENAKCKMVIGTDSLASNDSLSVIDEINVLLKNFKHLKIASALKWATIHGAEALNISNSFGSFIKGRNAGINWLGYDKDELFFKGKLA